MVCQFALRQTTAFKRWHKQSGCQNVLDRAAEFWALIGVTPYRLND